MTVAQVRKLLSDVAALQERWQARGGVIFRRAVEADAGNGAGVRKPRAMLRDERNAAVVVCTVYEPRPGAKRKRNRAGTGTTRP